MISWWLFVLSHHIKQITRRLICTHQSNNPFVIARRKGIIVSESRLKGILGYHHTYKRQSVICIHESLTDYEKRFVCAHELGHAILHPHINTPFLRRNTLFSIDRIEREANTFAVELLIPDEAMHALHDGCITAQHVASVSGVPQQLIGLKRL
ncbi:ImmA/IrrE family metallo-endopeptidase [Alicyclobacillus hesperidum]|uniref:ImmA/IrrE family metallo-endopeptidase n=1 Tax=Alicyclobacillus hesperidum TaxID=89784 RepID=UPI002492CE4D|nr:ImmA/IrrE family metallo-endopeptidase [Alicyclobacillus hesperidum]